MPADCCPPLAPPLPAMAPTVPTSLCDSSSKIMLLSAAEGIVGKNRTPKRGGEQDKSEISSCTAC